MHDYIIFSRDLQSALHILFPGIFSASPLYSTLATPFYAASFSSDVTQ